MKESKKYTSNQDYIKDLLIENADYKRRLGSKEYKQLSNASFQATFEKMQDETKSFYETFATKTFKEEEKLKILICITSNMIPSSKHCLYKNMLSSDTPVQTDCVEKFLSKLCSTDKEKKTLLKPNNDKEAQTDLILIWFISEPKNLT